MHCTACHLACADTQVYSDWWQHIIRQLCSSNSFLPKRTNSPLAFRSVLDRLLQRRIKNTAGKAKSSTLHVARTAMICGKRTGVLYHHVRIFMSSLSFARSYLLLPMIYTCSKIHIWMIMITNYDAHRNHIRKCVSVAYVAKVIELCVTQCSGLLISPSQNTDWLFSDLAYQKCRRWDEITDASHYYFFLFNVSLASEIW